MNEDLVEEMIRNEYFGDLSDDTVAMLEAKVYKSRARSDALRKQPQREHAVNK